MDYNDLFENVKNEKVIGNMISVGELMHWYAGEDWDKDWQTTNTMTVDDEHAQDDGEDGMSHLRDLKANEMEEVEVEVEEDEQGYEVSFVVGGKEYSFQSVEMPRI